MLSPGMGMRYSTMFDVDGVVAHFADPFTEWARTEIDPSLPDLVKDTFDFFAGWGWSKQAQADALERFSEDGGWRMLPADDEMVAAAAEVMGLGVRVEFVTARPGSAFLDTFLWLADRFGAESWKWGLRLEPSPKRCGAGFLAAFDDYDVNVRSLAESGCGNAFLVDQEWNQAADDLARVDAAGVVDAVASLLPGTVRRAA